MLPHCFLIPTVAPTRPVAAAKYLSPDAMAKVASDALLTRQLHSVRQVNGALLKQEEEELAKVEGMADKLLKQYRCLGGVTRGGGGALCMPLLLTGHVFSLANPVLCVRGGAAQPRRTFHVKRRVRRA